MHQSPADNSSGAARRGFTIIEVMIVIVLVSIVTALFLPQFRPSEEAQLFAAAHVAAADIQYCRNLAVTNGSQYQIEFDSTNNRYEVSHTGADSSLDSLPKSPFLIDGTGGGGQPVQYQVVSQQPGSGNVKIHEVTRDAVSGAPQLEFSPLGALTMPGKTEVWLTVGGPGTQRFIAIEVNSTTGAVEVGSVSEFDASGGGGG